MWHLREGSDRCSRDGRAPSHGGDGSNGDGEGDGEGDCRRNLRREDVHADAEGGGGASRPWKEEEEASMSNETSRQTRGCWRGEASERPAEWALIGFCMFQPMRGGRNEPLDYVGASRDSGFGAQIDQSKEAAPSTIRP